MFGSTEDALSYSNGCGIFQCLNAKNRNLCFLASGGVIESIKDFSSAEFAHLVADLREAFDFIIFDLPPFLGSSKTGMALAHLDLFFLVRAARKTTCADVEKCKKIAVDFPFRVSPGARTNMRYSFFLFSGLLLPPGFLFFGCSTASTPIPEINEKYRDVLEQRENHYKIKPGDAITIRFYNQDVDLNQTLFVLPDGRTDPFFMDDAVFGGKTVKELEEDIRKYYAQQIQNPEIGIGVAPAGETIILEGQVVRPPSGPVPLTLRMTLVQALGASGGYKLTACLHTIVVRRPFLDPKHPDIFRVNLRDYEDSPEELFLLPGDQIIVQRHVLILIRDYIDEYVWGFLPPFFRSLPFAFTAL
jgi:protein involved in polysaccharide export with SLBB domain